jgi:hypothetical protein
LTQDVAIRRFADRDHHIVRWTEFEKGGHFAAWKRPRFCSATSALSSARSAIPVSISIPLAWGVNPTRPRNRGRTKRKSRHSGLGRELREKSRHPSPRWSEQIRSNIEPRTILLRRVLRIIPAGNDSLCAVRELNSARQFAAFFFEMSYRLGRDPRRRTLRRKSFGRNLTRYARSHPNFRRSHILPPSEMKSLYRKNQLPLHQTRFKTCVAARNSLFR